MLIPTPFYGGFETDLEKRAGARCWEVQSSVGAGFQIGATELEAALASAQRAGTASPSDGVSGLESCGADRLWQQ